jgi:SNF family Na+-dependent transporter
LFIFFGRSLTLRGAMPGIRYLFKFNSSKLLTTAAWTDAATQTFFNLGLAYGTVISYSSFNPVKNNCQKDALLVATANAIVSIIASMTVFGIIGFKSIVASDNCIRDVLASAESSVQNSIQSIFETDSLTNISSENFFNTINNETLIIPFENCTHNAKLDQFKGGPGLAFIAFTEAIVNMPVGPLWSFLFFSMLLMVGISSQIGILLGFLLPVHDSFLSGRITQSKFTLLTCISMALVGVIFCLRCGLNWVNIFDSYSGTLPLLVIALCEVMVAAWVYKVINMEKDILFCCEFKSSLQPFWNICWKFVSPAMLFIIICISLYGLGNEVKVDYWNANLHNVTQKVIGMQKVQAPIFAKISIIFILLLPLSWIPGFFVFFHRKGKKGRYKDNNNNNEATRFVTDGDANQTQNFENF